MNSLFMELFEAAINYVEFKEQKNPLVKSIDRTEEFLFMELKSVVDKIEKVLQEVE